jgi:hypothetical protein
VESGKEDALNRGVKRRRQQLPRRHDQTPGTSVNSAAGKSQSKTRKEISAAVETQDQANMAT